MFTLAILTLLFVGQVSTPPSAKALSSELVISARPIQIATLPQTVDQARTEHRRIKIQLLQNQVDLESDLQDLQRLLQGQPCPTSIKIPKGGGEDIRFLLSILKDVSYETLEESFLNTWDEWQSLLIVPRPFV